jgi:putative CocE/NonD family hydrolase
MVLATISLTICQAAIAVAQPAAPRVQLTEKDVFWEFGYLQMKDGVRLAYVIWRPTKEGRYPTVFHYGPYDNDAQPFDDVKRFLESGYAFLGVNMRGSGCSEGIDHEGGVMRPSTVGQDGFEVVEWTATQPWSTGAVGMVGNSYNGGLTLATAATRPPHLKAIAPSGISGSDYREGYMPGGMVHLGGMAWWTLFADSLAASPAVQARVAAGDAECQAIRAKQLPSRDYWEQSEHPLRDAWWVEREVEEWAGQITAPTLIMMAWQDEWNLNAGTRAFEVIKVPHKKIVLQNGGHDACNYPMDVDASLRWLDRWLKGTDNGVDRELPVTVFWDVANAAAAHGSHAAPGWMSSYASWPVPQLLWSNFYLTADGKLSPEKPASGGNDGVRTYAYPAGTELVGSNEQFAITPYEYGSLSYQTEPMADDVTILGLPLLTFFFNSEQKDTDFMITLKDVDATGNTLFLQKAFLRASLRSIDKSKSSAHEIIQSFNKVEELTPGQVYEIKISIPAIGHVVRKGHRLQLSILAPSPIPAPVMGGVPVGLPSFNKIFHSAQFLSTLVLPIVPGEKARAAAPECGSLQNQPCRRAPVSR